MWQADFSQFETGAEGTWQLGGVVDYVSKVVLACPVTATQTAADLCAALDADTGELHPIAVVTDNGPAMKSTAVARWFEALKYKRLYRGDIADGIDLAEHVTAFTDGSNRVRTDEALGWQRPLDVHLSTTTLKPNPPESGASPTLARLRLNADRAFRLVNSLSVIVKPRIYSVYCSKHAGLVGYQALPAHAAEDSIWSQMPACTPATWTGGPTRSKRSTPITRPWGLCRQLCDPAPAHHPGRGQMSPTSEPRRCRNRHVH